MTDLTEFLLARIAEREDAARRAQAALGEYVPEFWDLNVSRWAAEAGFSSSVVVQISYAEPSRVLAECEAKRRIVELHQPIGEWETQVCGLCQWDVDCDSPMYEHQFKDGVRTEYPCETILALALPYADHPDYRQEWKQ